MIRKILEFLGIIKPVQWWSPEWHQIAERSTRDGQDLTEGENACIAWTGKCPDCGAPLYKGPEGGAAVNLICKTCSSKFNWGHMWGERISEPLMLVAHNRC